MHRSFVSIVVVLVTATLVAAGCAQAASPPTPTPAPAAPPEPTKASAAPTAATDATKASAAATQPPQPTAAPVKKADYPAQGRSITMIIPWPAGGASDIQARVIAPALEKELGVPVQVVNKPGAGSQLGLTALTQSKPDGYTIGMTTLASTPTSYLDPARKATYGRKDLQLVANQVWDPIALAVAAESPLKTLKDFVDAAKSKPGEIKVSDDGIQSSGRLGMLLFEKAGDFKYRPVHFDGFPPTLAAMLGGHVDGGVGVASNFPPLVKSQAVRVLGVMDKERYKYLPDAKTFAEQGYKVEYSASRGFAVPGGTPKEIVDVLSAAFKKAMESEDVKKKMEEVTQLQRYMNAAEYSAFFDECETQLKSLLAEGALEQ